LLTFSPGHKSYTVYGHTALRVQDKNKDIVYNFGIFDFDTPNFLLKFTKGDLNYKLGIRKFDRVLPEYMHEKQDVFEQPLYLNAEETKTLIEHLEIAYRPENRYYRYGFLQENCSTKLRDLIFDKIPNVEHKVEETGNSYRYYLKNYTKSFPWMRFGINLALGSGIDKKINTDELMFLPEVLSEEVEKASINGAFLAPKKIKILDTDPEELSFWKITPFIVFTLFFILMVYTKSVVLSKIFTFCVGLAGLAIFSISIYSLHPEVHYNYNLLWCNPLYLMAFVLSFFKSNKFHKIFTTILILCLIGILVVWILKIQGFVWGFFPAVACLFWINLKTLLRRTA